ncbi:MAG: DUF1622 domain-containing protein [Candidatus Dojkabacteria bacterium]
MMDITLEVLNTIVAFVSLIAVIIIVWGALWAAAEMLVFEVRSFTKNYKEKRSTYNTIKDHFAQRISISLEFLLAADLLALIQTPSTEELLQLGGLVAIRIAINFFLNRELEKDAKRYNQNRKLSQK